MQGIRLNKYISDSGFCSRREADELIAQERVTVNGADVTSQGYVVMEGDRVAVDGEPLRTRRRAVYIALNKPVGITCTTDTEDKSNITDFVKYKERIFPIGRLDKASQGLIFLTNDGDIVNKILRAGNSHEKEYQVTVDKPVTEDFMRRMAAGVRLDEGERTLPCKVTRMGERAFKIVLTQGLNRQIRRMCQVLHYNVVRLNRVRIMNVTLKGIDVGQWRFLTAQEVEQINNAVSGSSKVAPVAASKAAAKSKASSTAGPRPASKSNSRSKSEAEPKSRSKSGAKPAARSAEKPFSPKASSKASSGRTTKKAEGSKGGAAGASRATASKPNPVGRPKGATTSSARGSVRGAARGAARGADKGAGREVPEAGTSDRRIKRPDATAYSKYKSRGRR